MSNIKDVCCKRYSVNWSIASSMSSKLEPVIWLCDTGHIGIHGGAGGQMDRHMYICTDVMAIKPNVLTSMGYHIFLTMVLRARAPFAELYYNSRYKTNDH